MATDPLPRYFPTVDPCREFRAVYALELEWRALPWYRRVLYWAIS